ncbi:MAG: hypothetical protein ACXWEY_00025 [Bacteroidia bacterium]
MTDTKGWNIETSILTAYKEVSWTEDYFSETTDKKYGIYIYNINELSMLSYVGLIAIYDEKQSSKPLINSGKTFIWFNDYKTFDYGPLSDCLIFRKPAYKENSQRPNFPFLVIKPTEKLFAFIEWDSTSIYYGFNEVEKDKIKVREVYTEDLDNLNRPRRTNETINLNNLTWFDLNLFDQAAEIYHGQKIKPEHNNSYTKSGL